MGSLAMGIFDGKEPQDVLRIFEEISAIPRPSYQEKAIAEYIFKCGSEHGKELKTDSDNNVIIYLDATEGYENEPTIVLQAHTDMVCEKTSDCKKDMEKEGLDLVLEGDILSARGTTLGGDDGIGVAMLLAIMEDESLKHPALQLVFTSSEEVGMDGAKAFDIANLRGSRYLINLDSEKEGEILAGCAGGGRVNITGYPFRSDKMPEGYEYRSLRVGGLKGGHSGDEIDKGRANATRLMVTLLSKLWDEYDIRLVTLEGGSKDNAIPREASAVIAIPADREDEIRSVIDKTQQGIRGEYAIADPDIFYEMTAQIPGDAYNDKGEPLLPLNSDSTQEMIRLILSLPNGVQRMSDSIPGLVETSLNLGVTRMDENEIHLGISLRSSVGSAYEMLRDRILFIARCFGMPTEVTGEYPAWEFRTESKLRDKACKLYREMTGKDMEVRAIHAGLECGLFVSGMEEELRALGREPVVDAISMGPDIFDIHTPNEHLSISSLERTYDYLKELLAQHWD